MSRRASVAGFVVVSLVSVSLAGDGAVRKRRETADPILASGSRSAARAPDAHLPADRRTGVASGASSIDSIPAPILDGRDWLEANQSPNGSWGADLQMTLTGSALEGLATLDRCTAAVGSGGAWLAAQAAPNYEFLARQAGGLARAAGYESTANSLARQLLAVRNPATTNTSLPNWPEGGWGIASGYETDGLTTALALLALDRTGFRGGFTATGIALAGGATNLHVWEIPGDASKARILITVSGSTVRLRMKQGSAPPVTDPYFNLAPGGPYLIVFPDSGLPFTPGTNYVSVQSPNPPASPANYTMTASYETPDFDTRTLLDPLNYLRQSQNVDGGWGLQRGQETELYTTLHVLVSLLRFGSYEFAPEISDGIAYVKSQQLGDGSFGYDGVPVPYVTALAALALVRSETPAFSVDTQDAITALLAMQQVDGSWSHDAYDTSLAMLALWDHGLPPTAGAGADRTVVDTGANCTEGVTLSGSGSDPNGTIGSYVWREGCAQIATGATPVVNLPVGTHTLVLTVTDNDGFTGTDAVTFNVLGADADGDGHRGCADDCNDASNQAWATPGEALNGIFGSKTTFSWSPPVDLGGVSVVYDVLRSGSASDFETATTCVESNDGTNTQAVDATVPALGAKFFYLVRAENACPLGQGPLSPDPTTWPRPARSCP